MSISTRALLIRFKKRSDAPAALSLIRSDGSSTTGSIGPHHGYGPVHDLAHYVVEQTLGLSDAFLGLTAAGWTLADFEQGAAARVPDAAVWAESWAGELSREVLAGQSLDAADFNWTAEAAVTRTRPTAPPPRISEEQLSGMRGELECLWARWLALPIGGTLEVRFDPRSNRDGQSNAGVYQV